MKRKYPLKLFVLGVILNLLLLQPVLLLLGVLLCIAGIWNMICLWIGIVILIFKLCFAILDQIEIRKASLTESDNQEYNKLMDAFLGGDNLQSFKKLIDEKICYENETELIQRQEILKNWWSTATCTIRSARI